MKNIYINKAILFSMSLLLWTSTIFADNGAEIDEDSYDYATYAVNDIDPGGDPGTPASIDHWIPIMIVIGIAIVLYYNYKKKSIVN